MTARRPGAITHLPQLRVELAQRDERTVLIKASGELDLCSAARFAEALARAVGTDCRDVALDLGHLSFCDAVGVDLLVNAYRRLKDDHRTMSISRASPAVRRVVDLSQTGYLLAAEPAPADGR